jgi:cytochrome d ubiquinol oxidase subunit I
MEKWGEVFGVAFAFEGVSFFVEAIFIAIYVYGWDRLSPRAHLLSGVPIVIAGITGSTFVVGVNGWMNNPEGFDLVNGQVENVRPLAALFNNNIWHELVHMYLAGFLVAGFLVAGVYAVAALKGKTGTYYRAGLVIPLAFVALAAPAQIVVGDWAARTVAREQPTKLAAFEGLDDSTSGAGLTVGGVYWGGRVHAGIELPKLLSLLAFHDPDAEVQGLNAVSPEDRPPIGVVRNAFQLMVAIGTFLAVVALWFLWVRWRRGTLPASRWFLRAVVLAGPLSLVALIAGWITTEVGRQPWIVYGFMRTREAVTGADGIPVGYATLAIVYAALIAATFFLLRRIAREGPEAELRKGTTTEALP